MKNKNNQGILPASPYIVWSALFIVIPLLIVVFFSFTVKSGDSYSFSLSNFERLLDENYLKVFGRSLLLAAEATLGCLILGYPVAYLISKMREGKRNILIMLFIVPMWMNFLLRTYAWLPILGKNGLINNFLVALAFSVSSFGSFHQMIYSFIQTPLKNIGGSIWAMIFICFLEQLVWFFGIHGTNVIIPIVMPIWMSMDMQNLQAWKAGKPLPNITGYAFFNIVTWSGTALGLILLMLFFAKSKRYKTLGKLAVVPGLFGITEPAIFGTPLVLNFDFFVPFVFNNAVSVAIAYGLTKIGLVARFSGMQSVFGLPIGVIASCGGSVSIIVMQLVLQLVLSPLLWYPRFRMADNRAYAQEQAGTEK